MQEIMKDAGVALVSCLLSLGAMMGAATVMDEPASSATQTTPEETAGVLSCR